ncbi:hypothetical protein SAMN04490220_1211 [Rhodococcus jostii]|uniref:Uncharacterized protein n=1 Tax=Rhodococcus jostii TaxID=132919 RepID=A0A1H4R4W2_RHOJO|nr:hypothetical protein SAMN04490220_1211 [Rhodococcus jostii]
MGTAFHGPSPWPHITRAIRTRGPRHAAIAHLGQDAPTLLPLRAGDVLVVNASRAAVRAHATLSTSRIPICATTGTIAFPASAILSFSDTLRHLTQLKRLCSVKHNTWTLRGT